MDPTPSSSSLQAFGLLILASVAWVILVVLLLPRFLGRILSFLANRASRGAFHVSIPLLHIYPLAGRAVAHSLVYTVPDGSFSVEELVLQVRWWRKAPESQFRHLLAVDDANTLDPVAHAQQQLERENNVTLLKRLFFKLRRAWRRSAHTTDATSAHEPPPLISLICLGLRARLVNVQANYKHVQHVLNMAKASETAPPAPGPDGARAPASAHFDIPIDDLSPDDPPTARQRDPDAPSHSCSTTDSSSSYSSVDSLDAKPFHQRVLELVSLRITTGAFYLCDMGQSPLVRVVLNSAKVRYRYGAPACPVDLCRKRFRVRLSGLKVTVTDRDSVRAIVNPTPAAATAAAPHHISIQDNTDRMVRRVMAVGYRALNEALPAANTPDPKKRSRTSGKSSGEDSMSQLQPEGGDARQTFRYRSRAERREARRKQDLPCADVLVSETTVVDYVFDEPGPIFRSQSSKRHRHSRRAPESPLEGTTEDSGAMPAPVCRVSIVLRGASFSYDASAIADVERVVERLQPAFYDLVSLAMKSQSRDGKRSATGIQIEVDATPVDPSPTRGGDHAEETPFITIPFDPRPSTWRALIAMNVRKWTEQSNTENASTAVDGSLLPSSALQIQANHISIKTEVPYRIGAQQTTVIVGKEVTSRTTGVLSIPFCDAKAVTLMKTMQQPQSWNDVHLSSVDITLKDSEITYLPDTIRVIEDLNQTFVDKGKKPLDVRYFVPFKETARIRAEDRYTVVMACSHDNAWDDILSGHADRFGRIKVCGESGELVLSPNVPTEFFPSASVMSWTLSLPEAIGKLELPLPYRSGSEQASKGGTPTRRASDSDRSAHHKGRPPSFAQRVRSQLSILHHHEHFASVKRPAKFITVQVFQAGKVCSLTGKALANGHRSFLRSDLPAFLDSVNRSDISFKASSISLDINPHHVSHILSLSRNYVGTGVHAISTAERSRLHLARKTVTQAVLDDRRYPTSDECIILGLPAGQMLSQGGLRNSMDDLFCMSLQVDSVVLRLHALPHALCPFSDGKDKVCSVVSGGIVGLIRSNRLGSDLSFAAERKSSRLTLHCGYQVGDSRTISESRAEAHNHSSPTVVIDTFEVSKRARSSPDLGPYHSALEIQIGEISGCLMDENVVWLTRIAMAAVPESLFEDQTAVAALLSVDNIDVIVGKADLLVLSTASIASTERSGQMSKAYVLRKAEGRDRSGAKNGVPTFLAGVTQVRAPVGLRFFMSNLASAAHAHQSRLSIPDVSVDVLTSWGGKLTAWVDNATLKAQVAHAILARKGNPQGSFHDIGLMRRAADIGETTLEVVIESRPHAWSEAIPALQKQHISQKAERVRGHIPTWCVRSLVVPKEKTQILSGRQELNLEWWIFLRRSRRAGILSRHAQKANRQEMLESISIVIASMAAVVLSPESLELANDIIVRCKERACESTLVASRHNDPSTRDRLPEPVTSAEVKAVWDAYETSRGPRWTTPGEATPGSSFRGFETQSLKIFFMSPILPGELRRNDELFRPESVHDGVHICFPLGLHFVGTANTILTSVRSGESGDETRLAPSSLVHVTDFHSSVPSFVIGYGEDYICRVSGIVLIHREKSAISRKAGHPAEQRVELVREDKRILIGKVLSLGIGEEESDLHLYASFGRVAAIFVLMSRALALEYTSLLSSWDHRINALCRSIFHVPLQELEPMNPTHIRGFLSQVSRVVRDQPESGNQRTVAFSEDLPHFVEDDATDVTEKMTRQVVWSIDLALNNISLQVACEDILTADTFMCKGGSTAQTRKSSILDGHVLNATFGTISVSILDDLAADTLRMVSEVASFVRRATFSIPMLSYDGHGTSQRGASSELLSFTYANEKVLQARANSPGQAGVPQEQMPNGPFPTLSQGLHRQVHARRYNLPRTRVRSPLSSRFGAHSDSHGNSSNAGTSRYSGILRSSSQSIQRSLSWKSHRDGSRHLKGSGLAGVNSLRNLTGENTEQTRSMVDRRRSRPLSSTEIDQTSPRPRRLLTGVDTFEEDNQFYAYVAVPTAGETGPPRKRAKSRVRVSPIVPPAFSEYEPFSADEAKLQQQETVSSRRHPTAESNIGAHIAQRHAIVRTSEGRERAAAEDMATNSAIVNGNRSSASGRPGLSRNRPPLTVFVSCREIVTQYFRRKSPILDKMPNEEMDAEISSSVSELRLTCMSSPLKGSYSFVITASSAKWSSANDPNCVLTGSVANMGVTVSVAQSFVASTLPKLIASARVLEFKTTLRAKDLRSVMKFREEFKSDLKAIASAFITTKSSITKMARATRLSSSKGLYPGHSLFSTMAFDLLFEQSKASLEGFHPKDSAMCMSYCLDGMFFSVVASEDDSAALTLGLRLYGHRLSLFAPSWPSDEVFHFPSLDARGVQWGETTGLPTFLKVSAEPLVNCTSIQGLRHVLFTMAGLMAFQNTVATAAELNEQILGKAISSTAPELKEYYTEPPGPSHTSGATPFTRSFAAWERTKGIRMDLSLRPMSISLASGQVVALFELDAVTGIFEWNKLVASGVQLHAAVSLPRISLMFMRMPTAGFSFSDVRLDEHRASMSVALERSRIDVLKTQEDLTHTFIFRIVVHVVSGQLRPWRLLMDAAVWADEQEFVSELQSINYSALSSGAPRSSKYPRSPEPAANPLEHRIILLGFNIQRFKLDVPLLNSEKIASSRLALRATELHLLARRRFDSLLKPRKNIIEVKTHFIGVLWENSALLSTHHSRITLGVQRPSLYSDAHFGAVSVVMVAGTWRVCPRKDVVMAILEAKNGKDNRNASDRSGDIRLSFPDMLRGSSVAGDSVSNTTERHGRLLLESLKFTILRTSGFIEGLEAGEVSYQKSANDQRREPQNIHVMESSKLSVPAFSIAMVRDEAHDFDVIDIDFSGREGEFPRGCLQKVSNLLSELFGAVVSDQQVHLIPASPIRQSREVSRDVSVLIRFGKSLYRAQEEANTSVESKFCFFAGRTSTILVSLCTKPFFDDERSHTTVISGISPKLALEITPLIEGAKVQSLRLIDARFLHGITPSQRPHTLFHVVKVTALLDTKTLLLTQGRLKTRKVVGSSAHLDDGPHSAPPAAVSERKVMLVLGQPRSFSNVNPVSGKGQAIARVEPDIRLQVKLPLKNESPTNQVDLFVERLHIGIGRIRKNRNFQEVPLKVHVALHEVNLRGQWEILSCKLRLRENLFSYDMSGLTPNAGGTMVTTVITNIMNRLQFECMQYGNHTMKLAVDALAAVWTVPKRDILIESTEISTEISHTMIKAIVRLSGQMKKLKSEVSLLMEREQSKDTQRSALSELYSYDGRSADALLSAQDPSRIRGKDAVGSQFRSASVSTEASEAPAQVGKLKRTRQRTKVYIKGDALRATLRGYQFEETQHSAMVALVTYEVSYEYDFTPTPEPLHIRLLSIDFADMKLAYNDDERGIHSDLFKIPNPNLKMKVVDTDTSLNVELVGDLELKLGHGFYYWQDFKKLSELTIQGIRPTLDASESVSDTPPGRPEIWDGRVAQVSVRLNPRIDVIGDLTSDMLQFTERRRGGVDIVPKHLYDYIVVPLETLSETLCDALHR